MALFYDERGVLVLSDSMVDDMPAADELFSLTSKQLLGLEGTHLREVYLVWDQGCEQGTDPIGWLYDAPIVLRFDRIDLVVSPSYHCCRPALSLSFVRVDLGSPIRMVSGDWEDSERINGLYDLQWRAYDPMRHLFGLKAYGFAIASDEDDRATSVRFWLEGEVPIRVGDAFDETRIDALNEIDAELVGEYELYDACLLFVRRDHRGVPYPVCPRCGSRDVARITAGRAVGYAQDQDSYARGLLRLGNCMTTLDGPSRHCNACGASFGRTPFPLSLYRHLGRTPSMAELAWPHTQENRSEIESGTYCGCYGCLQIFTRFEIRDWLSGDHGFGETALCPKCGRDALIGDASGLPLTIESLAEIRTRWLEQPGDSRPVSAVGHRRRQA